MSGHTQGPWHVAVQSEPLEDLDIVAGISRPICRIWIDDAPVEDYNMEQKANARLIAAAPDMREVCDEVSKTPKEAVAIMEREGFVIDNLTNPWQKLAFTFYSMLVDNASKAEAAIAKAEGKS